ncbi:MAG TPA: succinyl-diaminopimelate desuccinylase [Acidimicrobiales bacterium]|jgi:succinyl-diaminopimelate desuccinylase|nr:succinyl-diaminopimelate desuccinylase [Acidimicrobiales bacterium]
MSADAPVPAASAHDPLPCDLLARTAALIDVPSVSRSEAALADLVEAELRAHAWLTVDRVADNVVARTDQGRERRVLLVGHLDTVPANGNERARIDGDTLWGLGAADMKGGLAIQLELARTMAASAIDVTYVFYACEEIEAAANGLGELFRERPELLAGDLALIGEPTAGQLEAGCQGTMRLEATLRGRRAHTARPWMGRNAIHRMGRLLAIVDAYEGRQPDLQGCVYREALQAVAIEGGVAGNVVPDLATVRINHRFAPDRSAVEAEAHVREVLAPALEDGDTLEVLDVAAAAPPALDNPLLAAFVGRADLGVVAKLGWTDVARFAARGVPAANFGPGDSTLAHTAEERLEREPLEWTFRVLRALLSQGL